MNDKNTDSLSQAPRDKESAGKQKFLWSFVPDDQWNQDGVKYALEIDLAGRNFAVYPDEHLCRVLSALRKHLDPLSDRQIGACRQGGKLHQHREADS